MYERRDDLDEELYLRSRETRTMEIEMSRFGCIYNKYFDCKGCNECMLEEDE